MPDDFCLGAKGMKLDAPAAGDIVTMKGGYTIYRCIAANGATAVLEIAHGSHKGMRLIEAITLVEWYEASELLAALEGDGDG